jgi:hypothetical protein
MDTAFLGEHRETSVVATGATAAMRLESSQATRYEISPPFEMPVA